MSELATKLDSKRRSVRKHRHKTSTFQTLPLDERLHYSGLVALVPDDRGYTAYQRIDALFAYLITASIPKAARLVGMKETTLQSWVHGSSWWHGALAKAKELKQEELDVQYTMILEKTIAGIVDRLDTGEEKVLQSGKVVKAGVSLKDLMLTNAIAYDKRALLRGDATTITEKIITIDDRNSILAEQFRKIAKGETLHVINGTVLEKTESGG